MSMDFRAARIRLMRAANAFWPMLSRVTVLRGASGFEAAIALSACAMKGEFSAQRSGRSQSLRLSADSAMIWFARWMRFVESGTHPASTNAKAQTHQPSFARTRFRITGASYGGVKFRKEAYAAVVRSQAAELSGSDGRGSDQDAGSSTCGLKSDEAAFMDERKTIRRSSSTLSDSTPRQPRMPKREREIAPCTRITHCRGWRGQSDGCSASVTGWRSPCRLSIPRRVPPATSSPIGNGSESKWMAGYCAESKKPAP